MEEYPEDEANSKKTSFRRIIEIRLNRVFSKLLSRIVPYHIKKLTARAQRRQKHKPIAQQAGVTVAQS
jgi:hypothetical protein